MVSTRSPWPSQLDYIMALQEPAAAFRDPRLQGCDVETDGALGLPKPRSGQMASVYKLFDGTKHWAIRCFNFESAERAQRYRAISAFLEAHPNPYTVGFEYDDEGIVVGTGAFPTVTMEWVEGELLPLYIARHRNAADVLERLAATWIELARDLHALGIAHGDLQHGNIVVTADGRIKLIDYDGMFVPAMHGARSVETGHPNYQHPCRTERHFGPQLDNFSAWVVYLSIAAVARDPDAWSALRFGDECLALRRADLTRPSESDAFALLTGISGPDNGKLARYVRSLLSHEPDRLPALEQCTQLSWNATAPDKAPSPRFGPFAFEPLADGAYREPYVPQTATSPPPRPPKKPPPAGVIWSGTGLAATAVGFAVMHAAGFGSGEFLAITALGWALAGILAAASREPKPPSQPM